MVRGATLLALACLVAPTAADLPDPSTVFEASSSTTWLAEYGVGKLASVDVRFTNTTGQEDAVHLLRLDVTGNDARARGEAHGYLLYDVILELIDVKLPQWFADMASGAVEGLDRLPQDLRDKLAAAAAAAAPDVFDAALAWVADSEQSYFDEELVQEMQGIAAGACLAAAAKGDACDEGELYASVVQVNMLPELIRMACTMFGAWGPASADSTLIQLRALDFGEGPLANYTVINTARELEGAPNAAFTMVGFPALVGAVTGMSTSMGLSEKVHEVYDTPTGMLPGSYQGAPDVFQLRTTLQRATSLDEVQAMTDRTNRTWAIFEGWGSTAEGRMKIMAYQQDSDVFYDDASMSNVTGQPYMESLVYVDKHPQPSTDETLPTLLTEAYGAIDPLVTTSVAHGHATADLHAAIYDHAQQKMLVAIGRVDAQGKYGTNGEWKAYARPYFSFDLADLFSGN